MRREATARAIAVMAFLLLAAVVVVPSAHAIPLLGNLGNTVNGGFGGNPDSGDEFVTGNVGLNISDIDLRWSVGNGATGNRLGIFTDLAGLPSLTQVGTWFISGLATTSGTTINYLGTATLGANTTYHLVVDILDASRASFTFNGASTADPSTLGASNTIGSSFGNIQTGSWTNDPANLMWR